MNIYYIKDNDGNPSIMFVKDEMTKVIDPDPNGKFMNEIDAYSVNAARDLADWFAADPPDNFDNIVANEYAMSDIENEISEMCVIYGEDIKHARLAAGMTQQEMADKFDIPKRTIGNWETGVNKCPEYVKMMILDKLRRMAAPRVVVCCKADNGDTFFRHNLFLREDVTDEQINALKVEAASMIASGDFKSVKSITGDIAISYYSGNTFIGNAGMHVTNNFDLFQNYIYISRVSDPSVMEKSKSFKEAKKLNK